MTIHKVLFYGGNGWIGNQFSQYLNSIGIKNIKSNLRVDNIDEVKKELLIVNPTHVVCMIGRTHGPGINSIDYLESSDKLVENLKDNLFSPIALALICDRLQIHCTYLGTGCIFNGPEKFSESAKPNFFGSNYSIVKGFTDQLMSLINVLNLRIRMPISDNDHPRNFISKIIRYEKICSIENSMTVLPTFWPIIVDMMNNNNVGTFNCTNPGKISHNEILKMYTKLVDPTFKWQNFSLSDQDKILAAKRSNNELSTSKLETRYPQIPNIHDAVFQVLKNWKK
jgi:3,5-epimerase/4-reductase